MFVILYQLILFGIRPIRKRILHWLEVAAEATDSKPHLINSLLYLGVTSVIPFIYVLIISVVSKFMNFDEGFTTILNWDYNMSFVAGICHLFIFFVSVSNIDVLSLFKRDNRNN